MRKIVVGVVLLGLVALAPAVLLLPQNALFQNCPAATCQTGCSRDGQTPGCAANFDHTIADGSQAMAVTYLLGTNTVVQLESSIDQGVTWIVVANTVHTTVGTPTNFTDTVLYPVGRYRTDVTGCGPGCTYVTRYQDVREQ